MEFRGFICSYVGWVKDNADFVLSFLQAESEEDIMMQLPIGFQFEGQKESDSDKKYAPK